MYIKARWKCCFWLIRPKLSKRNWIYILNSTNNIFERYNPHLFHKDYIHYIRLIIKKRLRFAVGIFNVTNWSVLSIWILKFKNYFKYYLQYSIIYKAPISLNIYLPILASFAWNEKNLVTANKPSEIVTLFW